MKKSEIKKFTKDQALKNLDKLKKDLFNLRFQKTNGQLTNPSKISQTKNTGQIESNYLYTLFLDHRRRRRRP